MLRFAPPLAILILLGPLSFGLLAVLFPAFGYFPSLGGHSFTLEPFRNLFDVPGFWKSAFLSLAIGLITTFFALGAVMAFLAAWTGTRLFGKVQALISPLLALPHAAAAFGLAFLIAPSGFLMRLFSPWATGFERPPDWLVLNDAAGLAMMAGLIVKEIPFLLLVSLAALPQVRQYESLRIAQSFGYGRMAGFLLTTWPLIYRQIRLAVFAVIAYASSVVDVSVILGPATPPTLSVRLTQWMNDPDLSLRFLASSGAAAQCALTFGAIAIWIFLERLGWKICRFCICGGFRLKHDASARAAALFAMLLCAGVIFAGLGILVVWSFAGFWAFPDALPRSFTFGNWLRALPDLKGALYNTILAGGAATLIAVTVALACLEREARTGRTGGDKALVLVYLPLLVPQIGFVFGLHIFFLALDLDAKMVTLVFVHLIFVLPYVFLSLSDPWRAWDRRYGDCAFGLGASPNRVFFRIRAPMLIKPILTAMAVGFAVSVGQYLPTLLIGAGRLPSITTEAVALASGGDRRIIGVYALLQMILPFLGFAAAALAPAFLFRHRSGMGGSSMARADAKGAGAGERA